ncbi:Bacterial inner-membrane translocator [Candidatus Magnetomorum sp. HK-1]|nr:Bacterial inner-membrane translocator [Candidatus Magnetomorum sp. HK-1]
MISYKLLLIINEGLIFGLFAVGVFIAFQWLRFPDLTPDGSFVLGACIYVKSVESGFIVINALLLSVMGGMVAGFCTAYFNKILKIPTVVSGLLVSLSLLSISWLLLGKPNQFLTPENTLVGDIMGKKASAYLFIWLFSLSFIIIFFLKIFADSFSGLRMRAIGENPLLPNDIGVSNYFYTFLGLGIANGIIGLTGALFTQRSYSADINMGGGQTIIGLIGMIIGLILSRNRRNIYFVLICIFLGAIIHKAVIFFTLEAGMPPESFKLISSFFFIILFFIIKSTNIDFLKELKWS